MRILVLIAVSISLVFTSCTKEDFSFTTNNNAPPIAFESSIATASLDNANERATVRLQVLEVAVEKQTSELILYFDKTNYTKQTTLASQQDLLFVDAAGDLVRHSFTINHSVLNEETVRLSFEFATQDLTDLQLFVVQVLNLEEADEKTVITEDIIVN